MKIPFSKRKIFRSLLRPYKQLDNDCLIPDGGKTYMRILPAHETPEDKHFKYKIVLLEYDSDDAALPTEEKSSIHTAIKIIDGQRVIFAYIVLVRSAFNDADVMQRTERLLCFAHELLFAAQYPHIVKCRENELNGNDLVIGVTTPNPLEENDLVCSHYTIARFFHNLEQHLGIQISGRAQLDDYYKSERGRKHFEKHWEENHSIASEIAYAKMIEFFERDLHQPLNILKKCYSSCRQINNGTCKNHEGYAKKCLECLEFGQFECSFEKAGNGDHGFDREFIEYLCGRVGEALV